MQKFIKPFSTLFLLIVWTLVGLAIQPKSNATDQSDMPDVEASNWSAETIADEVRVGKTVELHLTADVGGEGLTIYATEIKCDVGPEKPRIEWELKDAEIVGNLKSVKSKKKMDDIFDCEVAYWSKKAHLTQTIKITGPNPVIKGKLIYQKCSEMLCKNFSQDFNAKVGPVSQVKIETGNENNSPTDNTTEEIDGPTAVDTSDNITPADETSDNNSEESNAQVVDIAAEADQTSIEEGEEDLTEKPLWALFLLGIAGGLVALVTPCVFPMIPMTVAFFTKQNDPKTGRKLALFYGSSIIVLYTVLGLLLAVLFGPTFTYLLSTHWLPNIIFFLIFIFFGASFLGMFELTLPSSFVNKMDAKGDKGGYIGVFFIAFTLVLVSFSCTVPIVGSVSILASQGNIMQPLAAMMGFSLIFALPFTLFAFFPQWMNSLPKSGGWLNSVKVVLGFMEIALALKFLSQADLAYHWGILDRDVFLAIWIVLSAALGLYLMGKIQFAHDSKIDKLSVPRFILALVFLSFSVYMIPGLWGAPLKPLAGILPPLTTQDFKGALVSSDNNKNSEYLYQDRLEVPNGHSGYFDYQEALEVAKNENKPIFLDFTGHTCANCRKMEENVWPDPAVKKILDEEVIIASLYTDDKGDIPEAEQKEYAKEGLDIETLGDKNLHIQNSIYGTQAQPYYYIVNQKGEVLSVFPGYQNDPEKYVAFLRKGIDKFNQQK